MKASMIMLLCLFFAGNTYAELSDSVENAQSLYGKRGQPAEDREDSWALRAANMYERLAVAESDTTIKAELFTRASEALYWDGDEAHQSNSEKEKLHKKGYEIAVKACELLSQETCGGNEKTDLKDNQKRALADANYWYGANLGKWGKLQSKWVQAKNWPILRKAMNEIFKLGQDDIQNFGADRILGRAYYKLPSMFGGLSASRTHLQRAYDNTLFTDADGEKKFSVNGSNNYFLVETLVAQAESSDSSAEAQSLEEEAKRIALDFANAFKAGVEINPSKRPELEKEFLLIQEVLSDIFDIDV